MWILSTRGRPQLCQRLLYSMIAAGTSSPGIVIVDDDNDPAYRSLVLPNGWDLFLPRERRGQNANLNWVFKMYPNELWYGILNDDQIVRTTDWDKKLLAKSTPTNFVSSNDGHLGASRMAGGFIIGGNLARAWGWLSFPALWHWYADDVWEAFGRALGNWVYVGDVLVEHCHYKFGKSTFDDTYRQSESQADSDKACFEQFMHSEFVFLVERSRVAIEEAEVLRLKRLAQTSRKIYELRKGSPYGVLYKG